MRDLVAMTESFTTLFNSSYLTFYFGLDHRGRREEKTEQIEEVMT